MSLLDLIPTVRSLARNDQIQLMHFLVEEIGHAPEVASFPTNFREFSEPGLYEVFTPEACPDAADVLLKLLNEQKP